MAFNIDNFALGGGHANPNIVREHMYTTADDAIAAVNTAGYFNAVSDRVSVGDTILVKDSAGAVVRTIVASNASGVVDVTDGVEITATDTD